MIGRNKPPSRERTAEERARAAAERAARRGGTGESAALPAPEDVPAAPLPQPPPPAAEPPSPPPSPEPAPRAPAPEPAPPPPAPPEPELRPAPEPADDPPPPPPVRPRAQRPTPPRPAPPRPRRPLPPRPSDARRPGEEPDGGDRAPRWGRRILAVVALVAVAAAAWLIVATFQPGKPGTGDGVVQVSIPSGADAGAIGQILAERGVVDSATFFNLNATLTGRRGKLKSGDYTLARDMSNGAAIDALVAGPRAKVVKTFTFTIPEGRARREVAPLVRKAGFEGDYLKATTSQRALRQARRLGLPRDRDNPEGFLFPSTYEMLTGASARDLVDRQLRTFGEQFAEVDMRTARRRNLSRYDVVIIASMVEREAQLAKERPLIAAVIHNRLREGMTLGIDATIRYFENNWSSPLKVSELERDSPYNTRLRPGLPPTPIGNPGLDSLKAAASPADVDYLFYVVKPGTCGEHAFSSTDAEFSRDVQRYNEEREKAGGRSPTTC